jgi:hypothetical protein
MYKVVRRIGVIVTSILSLGIIPLTTLIVSRDWKEFKDLIGW